MPDYTALQIAILTMDTEELNTAAGIITDWTGRLLDGWFEDDATDFAAGRTVTMTCPRTCGRTWRSWER